MTKRRYYDIEQIPYFHEFLIEHDWYVLWYSRCLVDWLTTGWWLVLVFRASNEYFVYNLSVKVRYNYFEQIMQCIGLNFVILMILSFFCSYLFLFFHPCLRLRAWMDAVFLLHRDSAKNEGIFLVLFLKCRFSYEYLKRGLKVWTLGKSNSWMWRFQSVIPLAIPISNPCRIPN